jgi:hypothetical protein
VVRRYDLNLTEFWRDSYWDIGARQIAMHVLVRSPSHVVITFPAVESASTVADAIGNVFDALLTSIEWIGAGAERRAEYLSRLPAMDSRVQVLSPWSTVHGSIGPISVFEA